MRILLVLTALVSCKVNQSPHEMAGSAVKPSPVSRPTTIVFRYQSIDGDQPAAEVRVPLASFLAARGERVPIRSLFSAGGFGCLGRDLGHDGSVTIDCSHASPATFSVDVDCSLHGRREDAQGFYLSWTEGRGGVNEGWTVKSWCE
jgi:hypothetical protein